MVVQATKIIIIVNNLKIVTVLIDKGCESYAVISKKFVTKNKLKTFHVKL